MHTDLYQINMAKTYYEQGIHERQTIFDLYFRKMPFENGYAVFAGLIHIIDYLKICTSQKSDIEYLSELGYEDDFLNYLKQSALRGHSVPWLKVKRSLTMSRRCKLKRR